MIYLILSVLSSTGIFIIFKILKVFKINTLQVIVINYITACITGLLLYEGSVTLESITGSEWFFGAFMLGFLFISIFNVMALTAQVNGLSVASVASKMSVIIPIVFGIYVYNESVGFQKIAGIVIAMLAVYLTSIKPKEDVTLSKAIYLPILLFLGSGVIDTSIKYLETTYVAPNGIPLFSASIFGFAAIIGLLIIGFQTLIKVSKFNAKSIPLGVLLGVVNYCSIYFLLKALKIEGLESSSLFTINNVGIVTLTTLVGITFFKEHISRLNWVGIALAVIGITLMSLAQ